MWKIMDIVRTNMETYEYSKNTCMENYKYALNKYFYVKFYKNDFCQM